MRAAIGASRDRVLRAMGTPDASGSDEAGAIVWRYTFASKLRPGDERGGGYPILSFHFGPTQQVELVDCERAK
jgi:hypothetical protein